MTAPMTVAEIAVRLAAAYVAADITTSWAQVIDKAEAIYAELAKRGHIAPEPAPAPGPDWSQAPEWAQWAAMDEDGSWWWHEQEPQVGNGCFWAPAPCLSKPAPSPANNWRESLQRRPGGV